MGQPSATVRGLVVVAGVLVGAGLVIGAAGSPGARRAPTRVVAHSGNSHGRFTVDAAALLHIARPHSTIPTAEEKDQVAEETSPHKPKGCGKPRCGDLARARGRRLPSPQPTRSAFACCVGSIDPQVAAGDKGFLVVGMRDHILLYNKGGRPLYPKQSLTGLQAAGPPAPYGPIYFCDLFAPMIPDANAHLGLPTSKRDAEGHRITVENGYGINCDAQTGGVEPPGWKSRKSFYRGTGEIYDARVLWDEYHKRFVVAALFKNDNTVAYQDPAKDDPMMLLPSTRSVNVRVARRALLAIAVSKTDDPRDGWNLSWLFGYPGQEQCPNGKGCVGFATDYLSMGITSKYLVMESAGGTVNDNTPAGRVITIVPTAPLVAGDDAASFQPVPVTLGAALLQPAVQHAPDIDHGREAFFAAPVYNLEGGGAGDQIKILAIEPKSSATPRVLTQLVRVSAFHATGSAPQLQKGGTIAVERDMVNKLVLRGSSLFLTMDECTLWVENACLVTGLRYLQLQIKSVVRRHGVIQRLRINVADDQTIAGLMSLNTSSATWFGFPALEVNAGKDIVLGYQATSPSIFPQSRYSVQLHGDSSFRSSRVMKNGFATVGDSWHHYMGMSLDSFDDTGIWIVNGYADKSKNWGYAIGKVLGKAGPDLDVLRAYVQKGAKSPYELRLLADNLGDGAAPPTRTALTLTRRGSPDIPLKTFHTPAIPAGRRTKTFVVRLRLPAGTVGAGYTLRVDLDADKQVREYDEGNNTLFVLAP